ncbi:MAG: type II secretion system protein M [Proteobacteria bacterium]|nr:type II secretion system protein M [Pseudomonadota bacterium]
MIKKLTRREKYALLAAAGAICLFIVLQAIVLPAFDRRKRLEKNLAAKTKILAQMTDLKSEYDAIVQKTALSKQFIAQREKGFTLFSFLDKLSGKAGIKDHINYMKPSTTLLKNSSYKLSMVEMKIQGITLNQLIAYLHMVETSENAVDVKRLSISKTGKPKGFIDAVLQVETTEL